MFTNLLKKIYLLRLKQGYDWEFCPILSEHTATS